MLMLKVSTAASVKIGPFVDSTDGNTDETGLTLSQADIRLSKNGGDFAQKNDATAATHDELGYYDCPLNTTDSNTVGSLVLVVHESGALPVRHEYMVLPAQTYDSLVGGTDTLDVEVASLSAAGLTAISNAFEMEADTAQAGAASTITLAAGASAVNDYYNGRNARVFIRAGTGAGQDRAITDYVGATKVATVSPDWTVTPDATSVYVVTFV